MRLKELDDLPDQTAKIYLLYGSTNVGKTTSCLVSLPKPVLFIKFERRTIKTATDIANIKKGDIFVYEYVVWEELMDLVKSPSKEEVQVFKQCKSVVIDNITHVVNNLLRWEIEEETFDAIDYKSNRPLVNMTRIGLDGVGALSSLLGRFFDAITKNFIKRGIPVIFTALDKLNPKYNRDLTIGPNFIGNAIVDNLAGFFDMIGYVEPRLNNNDEVVYPPRVNFESPAGNFLSKFTGDPEAKKRGILDFNKILTL